jgi:translation initiation factor 1
MPGRQTDGDTLVYSTTPSPEQVRANERRASSNGKASRGPKAAGSDVVRIWLEKKGRNGTPVSIVRGLPAERAALAALATRLKRACGTGGSADGEIIIQGDHRARSPPSKVTACA